MQKWTLWTDQWAWQQDATAPCGSYGTLRLTVSCDVIIGRGDGAVVDSGAFVQDRGLRSLPVDECDCSGGGGGGGGDDDDGSGGQGTDDIDGDGIPNDVDDDIDGDGIPNNEDDDIDGDGIANDDDDDIDGDGILNDDDDTPNGSDSPPNFFELVLALLRQIIDILQLQ